MIGNFCNDEFWDLNKTWNSEVPDFSSCFQEIIFVSTPCIVFSLVIFVNICLLKPVARSPLPWTWLNISKLISSIYLLTLNLIWLGIILNEKFSGLNVAHSAILSSSSKVLLFVLTSCITLKHRVHRVITSWTLSIFWLIFTFCCIILHRSSILKYMSSELQSPPHAIFYLSMLYYPIVYVQLLLSVFVDSKDFTTLNDRNIIDPIPFLPYVTYIWFTRVIYKALKKSLEISDLGFLNTKQLSRYIVTIFSRNWQFYSSPEKLQTRSLAFALMKSFWPSLLVAFLLDFTMLFCALLPPLLLDRIIYFVHHDDLAWKGYMYAVIIFVVDFVSKIIENNGITYFILSGLQMKSALMSGVFRKCLILSTSSRKNNSSGTITNLMSVDIQRLVYVMWTSSTLVTVPLKIILILVLMWQYIGISTLAGVAVLTVLLPISYFISKISWKLSETQMEMKDIRLKHLNEVLSGIKILKMYAWEIPFGEKMSEPRKKELKLIFHAQICYIITRFIFFCTPMLVSIVCFATFLLTNPENTLNPTRAFVCLTLMEQLRYAIFSLPDGVAEIVQSDISLGRLKTFFATENKDLCTIGNTPDDGDAVTINQASFTWAIDTDCILNNIVLHIPNGKLVAIIGPVGSGKSSLLSAILGDMYKTCGTLNIGGELAYVPQLAWILNRTLRENILLAKKFNETRYNKILDLCCLRPDLEILRAGDRTEIGEKGVNLSGGQKQRINLARAVYQDKDIYLLDDTLSAVDVHVRKALFENVIGNEGLLKDKTRILVTHDLTILHKVDLIISMKDGLIDEIGPYEDLMTHGGSFTNFIQEFSNEKNIEENIDENKSDSMQLISLELDVIKSKLVNSGAGEHMLEKEIIESKEEEGRLVDDEKMEEGSVNRKIYWNYVKTIGFPLSFLGILGYIANAVFDTAANIWLSKWSADAQNNQTLNVSSTLWRLEIYGAYGFADGLSVLIGANALGLGAVIASKKYHSQMLTSLLRCPMQFFDRTPMGRITNRFSSDLDILDSQIFYYIHGWLSCFFSAIASCYIIGRNAPLFLASVIPIGIIYFTFQKWHLNTYRQLGRLCSTTKSPIYSQLLETIQGITPINAFKLQEEFIQSFEEKVDNHIVSFFNAIICNRWLNFYLDSLGSIIVCIASVLAIQNRHNLSAAEVALMIYYALMITDALKWLVRSNSELEKMSISVERVDEYCRLKSEAPWILPGDDVCNNWPNKGSITFENYCTKYREELDLVLKDLSLYVNGNEKVGIIGRTGAGKSSVTLALFRIIEPVSGTITIDNVNISEIGLHSLRSKLTIIPQDPVLFNGTLRSNLDPHKEYSDNTVWESLEHAHLKSFVSGLSEGLDYELEEGGANLSAGQRQLVCLARALLKNSKILVMDEATASVDIETDNLIQNTIRTAFANNTVITIAHRINTILDYDKIVVMENGSVVETGNPGILMKNPKSKFYHMCKDSGLI